MQQNDSLEYDHHLITDEMIQIFKKYITDNCISVGDMTDDKFHIFMNLFWKSYFNIEIIVHDNVVLAPRRSVRIADRKK